MTEQFDIGYSDASVWLPSAMVARLASIAKWYQKVAGSSPAVVKSLGRFFFFMYQSIFYFKFHLILVRHKIHDIAS